MTTRICNLHFPLWVNLCFCWIWPCIHSNVPCKLIGSGCLATFLNFKLSFAFCAICEQSGNVYSWCCRKFWSHSHGWSLTSFSFKQAVRKTAATFAPRSSTKSKNPAVPGSTLYTIFEVQGYVSMAFGGLLSYNLVFPSSEPDLWRLMGMWSVWMFSEYSISYALNTRKYTLVKLHHQCAHWKQYSLYLYAHTYILKHTYTSKEFSQIHQYLHLSSIFK